MVSQRVRAKAVGVELTATNDDDVVVIELVADPDEPLLGHGLHARRGSVPQLNLVTPSHLDTREPGAGSWEPGAGQRMCIPLTTA